MLCVGRDSSVGIATSYELDGRIQEVARFSAPVQTGPGANQASYTMGTGSSRGLSGRGAALNTPPPLALRLRKEYAIHLPPSRPSGPVLG
jgi:hypothetical protein